MSDASVELEGGRPIIVWLRQDLRLEDNPALNAAAQTRRPVIPLYILDETPGIRPWGAASLWWLDKSLSALDAALRRLGSRLVLRRGPAAEIVGDIVRTNAASGVFWSRLYDPPARRRDEALQVSLEAEGVQARSFDAGLLNPPGAVLTGKGSPFKVFGPYWRAARTQLDGAGPLPAPSTLPVPDHWPHSDTLADWNLHPRNPDWSTGFDWTPGEDGAHAALERFVTDALSDYAAGRDRPDREGSSRLSPYLHWGEIGPRQIWSRLQLAGQAHGAPEAQIEKYLAELGWREFNHQLLHDAPALASVNIDGRFDAFPWRRDDAAFQAWRHGRTGYPLVDAAMRQLWATGWMHNRMRMVAASFLIKHLLIDWREGEAWFWDTLVDADAANNAANWQWVAGSGADAQPFFRIFNPVTQGQRHDPQGDYVRRWVPELASLPAKVIHSPWTAEPEVLREAGVELGRDYPKPIVDHAQARARALDALRTMRS